MALGKLLRFDDTRGYGFIAPASGGEDVFVHANDFGENRHLVRPGMRVEYEVEEGDRGLKATAVRILDAVPSAAPVRRPATTGEDDGMCDVLAAQEFLVEVTEILLQHVPSLTGEQISQVRGRLLDRARVHGWVES